MKTQAAVLWEPGQPWQIEELELDPPKHGEVLLQLAASGMCHSDEHVRDGSLPLEYYPFIGGHEGAGVVLEVGPVSPASRRAITSLSDSSPRAAGAGSARPANPASATWEPTCSRAGRSRTARRGITFAAGTPPSSA